MTGHFNRRALLDYGSAAVIIGVLAVLISLQLAPSVIGQGRDSGTFAYTGWVIRNGGLPYVDAWDNKPPGVYYLDALAFELFGTSRWALWLIETIFIGLAALVTYNLLRRAFPQRVLAWTGVVIFLSYARHPVLIRDTNFTESFALLPQIRNSGNSGDITLNYIDRQGKMI